MQIKEWKFDKNINRNLMAVLVAKAEKRTKDEKKETEFSYKGKKIRSEKLAELKKRTRVEIIAEAAPNASMAHFCPN